MTKKIAFILLVLLLAALPIYGLAADRCPDHPNVNPEWAIHNDDGGSQLNEPYGPTKHKRMSELLVCPICHKYLKVEYVFELHEFYNGNVCPCGYVRPSNHVLLEEAKYLIYQNNIYNHACWVMYFGKLYASPSSSSTKLGELDFGEGYYVNDYQQTGNTIWIELKKSPSDPPVGWTTAEILSIDQKELKGPSGYEVGRTILITTSSGRGRADAGTEFPYLETVHYGDTYTVLDAKTGTNGNAWYKIRVDGREVWISSGLGILQ